VTAPDAELREAVAAAYGLDADAAGFLSGVTLEEVVASAAALGKLLAERAGQQAAETAPPNLIAVALEEKARRRESIAAMFCDTPTYKSP